MKKILFSVVFCVCFYHISAQDRKQYNGIFELGPPYLQNANALYTYYIEDGRKYFDGAFKFTFNGNNSYKGFNNVTTGYYKDDFKNGKWSCNTTISDFFLPGSGNVYETGLINLNITYYNGDVDGSFNFNSLLKTRTRDLRGNFSAFSQPITTECRAMFKKGLLFGQLFYKDYNGESNYETILDIQMDEKGFLKSVKEVINGNEHAYEYVNGILKDENYDKNISIINRIGNIYKNYPDSIDYIDYDVDTSKYSIDQYFSIIEKVCGSILFLEFLPGDNFYTLARFSNDYGNFKYDGLYYITLRKKISIKATRSYESLTIQLRKDIDYASKEYDKIPVNSRKSVLDVKSQIADVVKNLNNIYSIANSYYSDLGARYPKGDEKVRTYLNNHKINNLLIFDSLFSDSRYTVDKLNYLVNNKLIMAEYEDQLNIIDETLRNYNYKLAGEQYKYLLSFFVTYPQIQFDKSRLIDIESKLIYIQKLNKYTLACDSIKKMIIKLEFQCKCIDSDNANMREDTHIDINKTIGDIESLSFPANDIQIRSMYNYFYTRYLNTKPCRQYEDIYFSYRIVIDFYRNLQLQENNIDKNYEDIQILKRLISRFMLLLSSLDDKDSKKIEKGLKNAKDVEQIKILLLN